MAAKISFTPDAADIAITVTNAPDWATAETEAKAALAANRHFHDYVIYEAKMEGTNWALRAEYPTN